MATPSKKPFIKIDISHNSCCGSTSDDAVDGDDKKQKRNYFKRAPVVNFLQHLFLPCTKRCSTRKT